MGIHEGDEMVGVNAFLNVWHLDTVPSSCGPVRAIRLPAAEELPREKSLVGDRRMTGDRSRCRGRR
jgi:hypothetical protein